MYKYRDIFYKRYFSSQVGKSDPEAFKPIFEQQKWYFAKEIIPHFSSNKSIKILDIGCGSGSLLAAAKENGYKNVKGIDVSTEQVEIANKMGVVEVVEGDLNELIKASETYDLICAMDIIEHFSKEELTELVLNLKKILNPGGTILARTPNMDAPYTSLFSFGDFTHECLLNKSSALQLFKACGYSQTEVYSSLLFIQNPIKELLRKFLWFFVSLQMKIWLFASARTWHQVVFTPNLIIKAKV